MVNRIHYTMHAKRRMKRMVWELFMQAASSTIFSPENGRVEGVSSECIRGLNYALSMIDRKYEIIYSDEGALFPHKGEVIYSLLYDDTDIVGSYYVK